MGVRDKYRVIEEKCYEDTIEILDSDQQLEKVNQLLSITLEKAIRHAAATPDLGKGELIAVEAISKAFTRLREDQRKDDDHREKNESQMTREEMVALMAEQLALLTNEERQQIMGTLLNPMGGTNEDY